MRQQIEIFTTDTEASSRHAKKVNEFLKSNIELVSIQNELNKGRVFRDGTSRPEIVTIIIYKEL